MQKMFPVIDPIATGENIIRLRKARGLTVRDLQDWFGFEEPQAIYKWQKGKSLPTVDNLYALGALLDVPMEEILVARSPKLNMINAGQQGTSCCPVPLPGCFEYGKMASPCYHLFRPPAAFPKKRDPLPGAVILNLSFLKHGDVKLGLAFSEKERVGKMVLA